MDEITVYNQLHQAAVVKLQAADTELEAAQFERKAAQEKCRPSMLLRPALAIDGNKWGALFGENLQDGVAGFGDSPEEAYLDFDRNWKEKLKRSGDACTSRPSQTNQEIR